MLVLSRKVGERILIGDDIAITVVRIGQGGVRIGIDAPSKLVVVREELADENALSARRDESDPARPLPR
jgi:carbon storage regulator